METVTQLVQDLRSVPAEVYQNFCNQARIVSLQYPLAHGMDCFARGEGIEKGFINTVGTHVALKPNKKEDFNDPDALYGLEHLTDVKTQVNGFLPQKSKKALFYSKQWDIKKTAQGSSKFTSKAQSYILIDPMCARIAVVDTQVFYNKPFKSGAARISFSVKPGDVHMIYDGVSNVLDVEVEANSDAIFDMIWENAGKVLNEVTQ